MKILTVGREAPAVVAAVVEGGLPSALGAPHHLGIIASPSAEILSAVSRILGDQAGRRRIAVGEALARALLPMSPTDRAKHASAVFERLLAASDEVIVLDRIEILFLPALSLPVLELLRRASEARTIIVTWPLPSLAALHTLAGTGELVYATPSYPRQYVRAPAGDLSVWCVE